MSEEKKSTETLSDTLESLAAEWMSINDTMELVIQYLLSESKSLGRILHTDQFNNISSRFSDSLFFLLIESRKRTDKLQSIAELLSKNSDVWPESM